MILEIHEAYSRKRSVDLSRDLFLVRMVSVQKSLE